MSKIDVKKVATVLEALQNGMEVEMGGRTYVWLDDYPIRTIGNQVYEIDGLALKCESYIIGSDGKKNYNDYYMGAPVSLEGFISLCNDLDDAQHYILSANVALNKMRLNSR